MKKILVSCLLTIAMNGYCQSGEGVIKNYAGLSVGYKNSFGTINAFYGHNFARDAKIFELKAGMGTKNTFGAGVGINYGLLSTKKIDFIIANDVTHFFSGTIRYDDDDVSDEYHVSESTYDHLYLFSRIRCNNSYSFGLKTGYSFLLNSPTIYHINNGVDENFSKARKSTDSGVLIALDVIFIL